VSTSLQAALSESMAESKSESQAGSEAESQVGSKAKSQPQPEPRIVVVLVEPAGPLNVGSVARLCANFAIAQLRLVAPRCNPLGEEARRMAVHGQAQLEQAATYPDLAAAIADCRRVVATSGRMEREELPLEGPAAALGWLVEPEAALAGSLDPGPSPDPAAAPVALVFGREDRGLTNAELLQAGKILRLESSADYASLNLSHAVAICLHELRCRSALSQVPAAPTGTQHQGLGTHSQGTNVRGPGEAASCGVPDGGAERGADGAPGQAPDPNLAASPGAGATSLRGALEATLADAEDLLLAVGFLHPHTAHARMAKLRALLQRAQIREGEVALIRGMVRQLRWATTRRTP
jgi:tRNA/rRNA methyltransferase